MLWLQMTGGEPVIDRLFLEAYHPDYRGRWHGRAPGRRGSGWRLAESAGTGGRARGDLPV